MEMKSKIGLIEVYFRDGKGMGMNQWTSKWKLFGDKWFGGHHRRLQKLALK